MSWISEGFSYFRKLTLLDSEVERLSKIVDATKSELTEHDRRLIRIETLIEFARGSPSALSPTPRLPRGK